MAVLIEAISVIIRRYAIESSFTGGADAFVQTIPNRTACSDENLFKVGFMAPADVEAYVSVLEAAGLVFKRDGRAVDLAVVDQHQGPTVPAPWLEVGTMQADGVKLLACWLAGTEAGGIAVPDGWTYEGSLSHKPGYAASGTEGDRVKFLRHDDGIDVYLDLLSGKEVFVGRPAIQGTQPAALSTQLEAVCKQVLNLEAKMEPLVSLGDKESLAPMFHRLDKELLPKVVEIVNGPGRDLYFAHFTQGLILRILKRRDQAEACFRRAYELQPASFNTLLEMVKCLGEQKRHAEALPFARQAVELRAEYAGAWGNLAMCLIQCGERDEAREAIDHAIALDPQDPINRYIRDNFESLVKNK